MTTSKGLGNPLAALVTTSVISSDEGQKTISQTVSLVKVLLVLGGVYFAGSFGYKKFKEVRAKRFANDNIGHPDLIAATTIYQSFSRIGFPESSVLSYILGEINISTDEKTLYNLAGKVTSIKAVSNAYTILYDRSLQEDLAKGLSNKEAQRFWQILNSPVANIDTKTMYGVGRTLYSAIKGKEIRVNKAVYQNGKWKGTNVSYGNFKTGQEVGEIIANGTWTHKDGKKESYYIVQDGYFADFDLLNRNKGVVLQNQITDTKN
jgi:hypothetical protein